MIFLWNGVFSSPSASQSVLFFLSACMHVPAAGPTKVILPAATDNWVKRTKKEMCSASNVAPVSIGKQVPDKGKLIAHIIISSRTHFAHQYTHAPGPKQRKNKPVRPKYELECEKQGEGRSCEAREAVRSTAFFLCTLYFTSLNSLAFSLHSTYGIPLLTTNFPEFPSFLSTYGILYLWCSLTYHHFRP